MLEQKNWPVKKIAQTYACRNLLEHKSDNMNQRPLPKFLSVLRTCQAPCHHRAFVLAVPSVWKAFPPDLVRAGSVSLFKLLGSSSFPLGGTP